jgi:heme-degrading monooxygenase HmoA
MVLEVAMLMVKSVLEQAFETSFRQASLLIASMPGYESHELHQCLEVPGKYLLLVRWKTLEDHTVGFRESSTYQKWKKLLHHFYDPFPVVEHFTEVVNWKPNDRHLSD